MTEIDDLKKKLEDCEREKRRLKKKLKDVDGIINPEKKKIEPFPLPRKRHPFINTN